MYLCYSCGVTALASVHLGCFAADGVKAPCAFAAADECGVRGKGARRLCTPRSELCSRRGGYGGTRGARDSLFRDPTQTPKILNLEKKLILTVSL